MFFPRTEIFISAFTLNSAHQGSVEGITNEIMKENSSKQIKEEETRLSQRMG